MMEGFTDNGKERAAVLLPIICGTCWGIVGLFIRTLDEAGLDNPTIVFSRTVTCSVLMLIYILLTDRSRLKVKAKDIGYILAAGIIGSVLLMLSYNVAITELSLSLAAILLCLAPVFVLIISACFLGERITQKKIICMAAAFAGCVLLSGVFEDAGLSVSLFGILMGLTAALCNSIYIIFSKVIAKRGYSPFTVCLYSSMAASFVLIPFTDFGALGGYISENPLGNTGFLVLQAVISSLLPSLLYVVAMRHLDAGKTAILQSGAEPTAALLAGLIVYGEVPSAMGFAGAVITIAALMVLAGDREKRPN